MFYFHSVSLSTVRTSKFCNSTEMFVLYLCLREKSKRLARISRARARGMAGGRCYRLNALSIKGNRVCRTLVLAIHYRVHTICWLSPKYQLGIKLDEEGCWNLLRSSSKSIFYAYFNICFLYIYFNNIIWIVMKVEI